MAFGDSDLEKRYAFGRALLRKFPRAVEPAVDLDVDAVLSGEGSQARLTLLDRPTNRLRRAGAAVK